MSRKGTAGSSRVDGFEVMMKLFVDEEFQSGAGVISRPATILA
jgi:hypothetical protein